MQWDGDGNNGTIIADTNIVDGMQFWNPTSEDWSGEVRLSQRFHDHLKEHAVPRRPARHRYALKQLAWP